MGVGTDIAPKVSWMASKEAIQQVSYCPISTIPSPSKNVIKRIHDALRNPSRGVGG